MMTDMFDELFGTQNRWDAERDDDFGNETEDEPDEPVWFDDDEGETA